VGRLPPDVRDLLLGLTTLADDEGWMLWRPSDIAATLYPFDPVRKRETALERRAKLLVADGLLVIRECGCAVLPSLPEHHAIKGGDKNRSIWKWHHEGGCSVALHSPTDVSASVSGSSSSSSSVSDKGSSSVRVGARDERDSPTHDRNGLPPVRDIVPRVR
jgi:hypothetical protein